MKKIIHKALLALLPLLSASCDLMEMDDQVDIIPTEMSLGRDTLYIMVGDQIELQPTFSPDSVTVNDVLWTSSADSVLSINNNVFTGISEGWTTVQAISVSHNLIDSCHVNVMKRWESAAREYPYEMMVYAAVTVHGQPFNPETMMLGAFVDDEMRGASELMEWKGRQYVRFRVGSELPFYNPDGIEETVTFRVYHRQELRYEAFPQTILYDGEAHGSLSNLFALTL
jgi:hypothetical protein